MTDFLFDLYAVAVFGSVLAIGIVVGFAWGMRLGTREMKRTEGWEPLGQEES